MKIIISIIQKKQKVINFRSFMSDKYKPKLSRDYSTYSDNMKVFSIFPTIKLSMFIDTNFLMIVGCVVLVALIEKGFAKRGHIAIAHSIYVFLKLLFPVVALVALYILISKLTFF